MSFAEYLDPTAPTLDKGTLSKAVSVPVKVSAEASGSEDVEDTSVQAAELKAEEDTDEKLDSDDDSKDDSTTSKASKLSKNEKRRAKTAALAAERDKLKAENAELARQYQAELAKSDANGHGWRARAELFEKQLAATQKEMEEKYGRVLSDEEKDHARLRFKEAEMESQQAIQAQLQAKQVEAQNEAVKNSIAMKVRSEAAEALKKYPQLTPEQLIQGFHDAFLIEQMKPNPGTVTMEDVARRLAPFAAINANKDQHIATREHLENNKTAPRSVKTRGGSSAKPPDFNKNPKAWNQWAANQMKADGFLRGFDKRR